jgi:hypothetical protein
LPAAHHHVRLNLEVHGADSIPFADAKDTAVRASGTFSMPDGVSPSLFTIVDANKSGVEVKEFLNGKTP